jgi:uncharacterized protein YciI
MKQLFAVIHLRGPAWNSSSPLEGQEDWVPHKDFVNALHAEGFVLLAGPLEGTSNVLLIVRADNAEQIRSRIAQDPWIQKDLLRFSVVAPWTLRIGSLD